MLRKGAPTAFVSIKGLYKDSSKVTIIENMLQGFLKSLEANGTFAESGELIRYFLYIVVLREFALCYSVNLSLVGKVIALT